MELLELARSAFREAWFGRCFAQRFRKWIFEESGVISLGLDPEEVVRFRILRIIRIFVGSVPDAD